MSHHIRGFGPCDLARPDRREHVENAGPPRERALRVVRPPPAIAIAVMGDEDLEELRRALAHALSQVRLGSSASPLLGTLSRKVRAEQRRRARQRPEAPRAA